MVSSNPNAPITDGVDFNRFFEATITSTTFQSDADTLLLIRGPSLHFYIRNGSVNELEFSFNGNTLHGRILANSERLYAFRRVSKIWFRAPGGNVDVEVEAWATS